MIFFFVEDNIDNCANTNNIQGSYYNINKIINKHAFMTPNRTQLDFLRQCNENRPISIDFLQHQHKAHASDLKKKSFIIKERRKILEGQSNS